MKTGIYIRNGVLCFILFVLLGAPTTEPTYPTTPAKLGELLFSDPILSADSTISCASCHKPEFAFADTLSKSIGFGQAETFRNTPTVTYMSKRNKLFWDGRARSLEEQASGPITHPDEMNLPISDAVKRLEEHPFYKIAFDKVYDMTPDSALMVNAIAEFQRSLEVYDSPYDRFLNGDDSSMSESAIRGMIVFFRGSTCANDPCHSGSDFSQDSIVSAGVVDDKDLGLFSLTKDSMDINKFKTPHLRNVAITGPYMHDGSVKTLREVVEFYNEYEELKKSNAHPLVKDPRPTKMTEQEIDDLVAFMESLTDYRYLDLIE